MRWSCRCSSLPMVWQAGDGHSAPRSWSTAKCMRMRAMVFGILFPLILGFQKKRHILVLPIWVGLFTDSRGWSTASPRSLEACRLIRTYLIASDPVPSFTSGTALQQYNLIPVGVEDRRERRPHTFSKEHHQRQESDCSRHRRRLSFIIRSLYYSRSRKPSIRSVYG